jgi:UDP-2,3-diacylglucosamine pyrophosphatase LpxH
VTLMDNWEERIRGPGGIQYGVWIPRDPNYVKKQKPKAPEPPKVPANDSITIRVIDAATGEAVPKVLLDLKIPDGSVEQHETRRSGMIESLGLISGECELSGDLDELTLKNTLLKASNQPVEDKAKSVPPPPEGTTYRIASVETYRVKAEESMAKYHRLFGIPEKMLAAFNWGTDDAQKIEDYFEHSDLIYIPKKWSKTGLATNQHHTVCVNPFPAFIEDDLSKRGQRYTQPLYYKYDPDLAKDRGGFRFIFNKGALTCSHVVGYDESMCEATPNKMANVNHDRPSFVYLDIGCWCDSSHGGSEEQRRDFAIVCGPHVYLCEFNKNGVVPLSRVETVQNFFVAVADQGYGINVVQYLCANTWAKKISTDANLYLFLGDLHLPPSSWFKEAQNSADIFKVAGDSLILFLFMLSNLSAAIKQSLHVIQTGDMFEMWLGRDYLFKAGNVAPEWATADAPQKAIDWLREVIDRNGAVMGAFKKLEHAGLAEVRYLWGNHDAYLQKIEVTSQLDLPKREPYFKTPTILCEHGHRFHNPNFDNISPIAKGHFYSQFAYWIPPTRMLAPSEDSPSDRHRYLLGATLVHLYQSYDRQEVPFSIYIMGHTHSKDNLRFEIKTRKN